MQFFLASPDSKGEVTWFAQEYGLEIPVLLDPDRSVLDAYDLSEAGTRTGPYPVHVVVDEEGIVRFLSVESDLAEIRTVIEDLLAE